MNQLNIFWLVFWVDWYQKPLIFSRRVEFGKDLLKHLAEDTIFIKRILTDGVTWVYEYDVGIFKRFQRIISMSRNRKHQNSLKAIRVEPYNKCMEN